MVGIGLLYQQGYFRHVIAADGGQEELYPFNDPGQLPVTKAAPSRGGTVAGKERVLEVSRHQSDSYTI